MMGAMKRSTSMRCQLLEVVMMMIMSLPKRRMAMRIRNCVPVVVLRRERSQYLHRTRTTRVCLMSMTLNVGKNVPAFWMQTWESCLSAAGDVAPRAVDAVLAGLLM